MINLNLVTKIVNSKQMKNLILTGLVVVAAISLSFGQLKVVAPDGNVNLGDITGIDDENQQKLNVGGNAMVGNNLQVGALSGADPVQVQVGLNRGVAGNAFIDLLASTPDAWNGRFIANTSGVTSFSHRGSSYFYLKCASVGSELWLGVKRAPYALIIDGTGRIGMGGERAPQYDLHLDGTAAKPGGGSWTNASDKRLKTNIVDYNMGLQEVLKLNPVYYNYNGKGGIKDTESRYVGLIAQEYQKIAPDAVKSFKHTEIITDGDPDDLRPTKTGKSEEYLALDPSQITFMLVNAIKDQQKVITELQEDVKNLKINGVNNVSNTSSLLISGSEKALLSQNTPNPFTSNTSIEYFIPSSSKTAEMIFTDITGKTIKSMSINHIGQGSLDVSIKEMPIGIYSYSLVVDGSSVVSKKMVLSR